MYIRPFEIQSDTVNTAVTTASQTIAVNPVPRGNRSLRITNIGTQPIFVCIGGNAVTTSVTTGTPIPPNDVATFLLRNEDTSFAVVAAATGSTVYATVGEGMV